MKLYKYLTAPKSFSNVTRQSLEDLSGNTSLQLRHQLKESWQLWVDTISDRGLYDEANKIISKKFNRNIKEISRIQPSTIVITESYMNKDVECTYTDIMELLGCHENLTLNALFWATLCNEGSKMRLKKYLTTQSYDYSSDILEVFMIIHQDELLNETFDLNSILQKVGFTFKKEKGLIQMLMSAGKGMYALFKATFTAWYTGEEEHKEIMRQVISDHKITKEHVVNFLFNLDEATLHLLTGPLYLLSAVTGWTIRPKDPHKQEITISIENKIKQSVLDLGSVVSQLPKKIAKNFKAYLKGLANLVCRDLNVCVENKDEKQIISFGE